MTTQPAQPTLPGIRREHPTWLCWTTISGRYQARPTDAQPGTPAPITASTLTSLRDQLHHADPLHHLMTR
jgi:hypothetical protein